MRVFTSATRLLESGNRPDAVRKVIRASDGLFPTSNVRWTGAGSTIFASSE